MAPDVGDGVTMAIEPSDEIQAEPAQERRERKPGERAALWAAIAGATGAVIGAAFSAVFGYLEQISLG